jgi:hypothetical protein
MKSRSAPSDPLIKALHQWKKDQAIISLTIEEMEEEAKGKNLISEQKVDGQSAILDYKEGSQARFGSLGGMIMWDLPLCDDLEKTLKAKKIHQIKAVGEMAGYANGKIIPFNESESLIKNHKADKTKVHWFPYQILELNGEKIDDSFEAYKKFWPELVRIFKGSKYAHPVDYYQGGVSELKKSWNKLVLKEKNEGIVVRLSNNKVYKAKPLFSYDLAIIAVGSKKGKNWPKRMIGMCLMAFMDNNHIFRTAGHVASGVDDKESKELFTWAHKNKVDEDETYVWVKPHKIMEIRWERTSLKEMPAYKYSKGKYEPAGKMMSGTIVKPRFIRWRADKTANPNDLRLTQVPGWVEKKKMAMRIASVFIGAQNEETKLNRALIKVSFEMYKKFKFKLPKDVEWRTSKHPDFKKDSEDVGKKDEAGFITKDWKKIYLNTEKLTEPYEDFVAHEMGHLLDHSLGDISSKYSKTKVPARETFAMMVNYVLIDNHSGDEQQTEMYNAVCGKQNIVSRVKPRKEV